MTLSISSLQEELLKLFNPVESSSAKDETPTDVSIIDSAITTNSSDLTGGQNISEIVGNILEGGNVNKTTSQPESIIKDILLSNSETNSENEEDKTESKEESKTESKTESKEEDASSSSSFSNSENESDSDDLGPDEYLSIIKEFTTPLESNSLSGGATVTTNRVKIIPYFPYILK